MQQSLVLYSVVENPGDLALSSYQLQRIASELSGELIVQIDDVPAK
jgi:hypothetical protein